MAMQFVPYSACLAQTGTHTFDMASFTAICTQSILKREDLWIPLHVPAKIFYDSHAKTSNSRVHSLKLIAQLLVSDAVDFNTLSHVLFVFV